MKKKLNFENCSLTIKDEKKYMLFYDIIPRYIKVVCRICGREMTFDVTGSDYNEEYILECKECNIKIELIAGTG